MQKSSRNITQKSPQEAQQYPPVVSVLGHVDHGKTTLLDKFRKTSIASSEHGGITQRIGASEVEVLHDGKKRRIIFIDTPGHEAFSNMRSQGVSASDIVLLVVSAVDGVMPQTIESITKIKQAQVPYMVVISKIDLETSNMEKTLGELTKNGIALEGRGGDIPYIAVSGKTGENIDALLDLILLVYDLAGIKKDEKGSFLGVVADCRHDKKIGNVATVVVKQGRLIEGDCLFESRGEMVGKIKAVINTFGKRVTVAYPGDVIEILGIERIIPAGSLLYSSAPKPIIQQTSASSKKAPQTSALSFLEEKKEAVLRIVLKTETAAEYEAIESSLPSEVEVVDKGQGEISVSDVMSAKDVGAVLIGFNVGIAKEAKRLCESEGVLVRIYKVIYELIDEIKDTIEATIEGRKEVILGRANIVAVFATTEGKVAGSKVLEGKLSLNDTVKVLRGKKELGRSKVSSLRRGRENVKSVEKGAECGIILTPNVDFVPGDVLLSYRI